MVEKLLYKALTFEIETEEAKDQTTNLVTNGQPNAPPEAEVTHLPGQLLCV